MCDCNELVRLSLRSEVDRTLQGLLGETTQACRLYWWLSSEESSPVMQELQETQVRSLGGKDLLEEGMVTHSSVLAWRPSHGQRNLRAKVKQQLLPKETVLKASVCVCA